MQEALIAAAAQWPRDGVPDNPRGWLIQVAQRRMVDHLRSEIVATRTARLPSPRRRPSPSHRDDVDGEPRAGSRRHARAAVHVLSSVAHAGIGDRADAARGRRPHDRRDREARFSCPRRRSGNASAGRSRRIKASGIPFRMPDADERAAATGVGAARAVSHLQRRLHDELGRGPASHRSVERSDSARRARCTSCCPTTETLPACWR